MTDRVFVIEPQAELIADASVVINLIATGIPAEILAAVPNPIFVPNIVVDEIERGRARGRPEAAVLEGLIVRRRIGVRRMSVAGERIFEELVAGSGPSTLDDGEAATIACCAETGSVALIDERKAVRICAERFHGVRCASAVDLLTHPVALGVLGEAAIADAVFKALQNARMRVWPEHVDRVVDLIGVERARGCNSLPSFARF